MSFTEVCPEPLGSWKGMTTHVTEGMTSVSHPRADLSWGTRFCPFPASGASGGGGACSALEGLPASVSLIIWLNLANNHRERREKAPVIQSFSLEASCPRIQLFPGRLMTGGRFPSGPIPPYVYEQVAFWMVLQDHTVAHPQLLQRVWAPGIK